MNLDGGVDWSSLPAPAAGLRCTIVLPARDEAALLPRALRALADQRQVPCVHEVIALANNCSDDTATIAREFASSCIDCAIHVVEVSWPEDIAHVGRARRALMDVAASRVASHAPKRGIVLSTDADTRVASDWLATTVMAIDAGADAVGGRIIADVDDVGTNGDAVLSRTARRLMRLDDDYRAERARLEWLVDPDPADPWPRHHQHFGASLAVTASAYRAVGGLPLVPFLEDEALVQALRLEDRSVRHCPQVRVHTSARLDGRTVVGLSWQLREWSRQTDDGCPRVPDPAAEARRWAERRSARSVWSNAQGPQRPAARRTAHDLAALAATLRIDVHRLQALLARSSSFGRWWVAIEQQRAPLRSRALPMDEALRRLRWLTSRSWRPPGAGSSRGR